MAFLLPSKLFCCFVAIVLFLLWKIQRFSYSLLSSFPLLPFFLLCLLECLQARPRHHVISPTKTRTFCQTCCENGPETPQLLRIHSFTPWLLVFAALPRCGIYSLKSHQWRNPEVFLNSHRRLLCSLYTLLSVAQHHVSGAMRRVGG